MKDSVLGLLGLLAVAAAPGPAGDAVWSVRGREVPPPSGASAELREAIAATPQPDPMVEFPSPETKDEWRAFIREFDTRGSEERRTLAERLPVSVEKGRIAGVEVHHVRPEQVAEAHRHRLFLYLHGGAYILGRGEAGLKEARLIAARLGIPVLSVDYRMPPDHPHPAAVDDVVAVYRSLCETRRPGTLILGGTSAGGGLALASVHRFKALGLPVPGAVYAGTPWADLTKTGDTLYTNEGLDRILIGYDLILKAAARLYAGEYELTDPLISPVYGDFRGFAPTILISGTRDLFLSDVSRAHRKLRAAEVEADLHVYEGMSHAEYVFVFDSPEALDMYRELEAFVDTHLE